MIASFRTALGRTGPSRTGPSRNGPSRNGLSRAGMILSRHGIRFCREDWGTITVEAIIAFPVLCWAYLLGFTYFDGFKVKSLNDTAAFAIADALSRETELVSGEHIASMLNVHKTLTIARHESGLRISQVVWDEDDARHYLSWSIAEGAAEGELTDADLVADSEIAAKLPLLTDNERMLIVETFLGWDPASNVGLKPMVFEAFTPIRPRYAPKVCLDRNNTGDVNLAEC